MAQEAVFNRLFEKSKKYNIYKQKNIIILLQIVCTLYKTYKTDKNRQKLTQRQKQRHCRNRNSDRIINRNRKKTAKYSISMRKKDAQIEIQQDV